MVEAETYTPATQPNPLWQGWQECFFFQPHRLPRLHYQEEPTVGQRSWWRPATRDCLWRKWPGHPEDKGQEKEDLMTQRFSKYLWVKLPLGAWCRGRGQPNQVWWCHWKKASWCQCLSSCKSTKILWRQGSLTRRRHQFPKTSCHRGSKSPEAMAKKNELQLLSDAVCQFVAFHHCLAAWWHCIIMKPTLKPLNLASCNPESQTIAPGIHHHALAPAKLHWLNTLAHRHECGWPRLCESHKQSIGIQIASEPNGGPGCPHSQEARFGLPLCGHTKPSFVPPPQQGQPNAFMVGHVGQRPEDDGHWYEKAIPWRIHGHRDLTRPCQEVWAADGQWEPHQGGQWCHGTHDRFWAFFGCHDSYKVYAFLQAFRITKN